jgi:sec-independent protein translocase protein TatB
MNFGVSGEMIFLFLLVLILFGPKKMPEIARQIARLLNEFRRASNEFRSQIESEVSSLDGGAKPGRPPQPSLTSLQAPLGSLANRIFNSPAPDKCEVAVEVAPAPAEPVTVPEPAAAPKVAPDA